MATHSSILAWKIPWTEEPGGLQSMGSQRVGQDCGTNFFLFSLGRQLYHYSVVSCKDGEGVHLLHHDLLRETYCCINDDRHNDGGNLPEKSKFGLEGRESVYDLEPVVYK